MTDFEQSPTDNLSPGNGILRSPGYEVITFVAGLYCASSRKTWVNRLYDYQDGRLWEWRKCFLTVLCSLARKKFLWWKFSISGEREVVAQIGSLLIKSRGLECLISRTSSIVLLLIYSPWLYSYFIFFTFCLSPQLKNNKRFNVQKAIFYLKEKHFLKMSLLVHSPTPHLLSKYQKLYKQSGKKIALACREIRQKKKLFIENKRIVCLVCISVCL